MSSGCVQAELMWESDAPLSKCFRRLSALAVEQQEKTGDGSNKNQQASRQTGRRNLMSAVTVRATIITIVTPHSQ